jgi:integrase
MYKFAWEQELLDCQNPCSRVKSFPERKRKRFATPEEIAKLGQIMERERATHMKQVAFLELMIYTGSRPKAIEDARWSDLEEHRGHMILSVAGKTMAVTGDMDTIVVPPQAVMALRSLGIRKDHSLIFGIKMPRRFWNRIRKEAGCEDLWARDWRRTFASVGLSSKESLDVIGEALNHKSRQTTLRYAKLLDDKKVAAVSRIANELETLLGAG